MKVFKRLLTPGGIGASLYLMLTPFAAKAIVLLPPCTKSGDCEISDMLVLFVNLSEYMLGIMGSIALAYFVYGGFVWILSAGNAEKVGKGKTVLRNATIGIAIIFLSGVIVRFTTEALTGQTGGICTFADANSTPPKCFPIVGGTCKSGGASGSLWIQIPAGWEEDTSTASGIKIIEEGMACVPKETSEADNAPCRALNAELNRRNRSERYFCFDVTDPEVSNCIRGLCSKQPANIACCRKPVSDLEVNTRMMEDLLDIPTAPPL